ncbi:MAG: hypothetical protein ACREXP_15360, partial [Steroidobacteraceae bacterium]
FARELWRKIFTGQFALRESCKEFVANFRTYVSGLQAGAESRQRARSYADIAELALPDKTAVGLNSFDGHSLILISGRDYIAKEFDEVVKESTLWQKLLLQERVKRVDLAEADHTFSREVWRVQAVEAVRSWMSGW